MTACLFLNKPDGKALPSWGDRGGGTEGQMVQNWHALLRSDRQLLNVK